jgi:hypothetical protein
MGKLLEAEVLPENYDLNQIYATMGQRMGYGLELDRFGDPSIQMQSKENKKEVDMQGTNQEHFENYREYLTKNNCCDENDFEIEDLASFLIEKRLDEYNGQDMSVFHIDYLSIEIEPSIRRFERKRFEDAIASTLTIDDNQLIKCLGCEISCAVLEEYQKQSHRISFNFK